MPFRINNTPKLNDRSVTVELEFGATKKRRQRTTARRPKGKTVVRKSKPSAPASKPSASASKPNRPKSRRLSPISKPKARKAPASCPPQAPQKRTTAPRQRRRPQTRPASAPAPVTPTTRWRIDHPQNRAAFVASVRASRPQQSLADAVVPTATPEGLADATPEQIAFVRALNAKFEANKWALGWGKNNIRFEAYCGGKNGYVVRRYVLDCTDLEKPIGMGPKGLDNFFQRHHGISWNTFLATPSDDLTSVARKMGHTQEGTPQKKGYTPKGTQKTDKAATPKTTPPKTTKPKSTKPAPKKQPATAKTKTTDSCPPMNADGTRCVSKACLDTLEKHCGSGKQTLEMHTVNGKLTAERKELHDKIISDIKREQQCVAAKEPKRRPIAVLTGGAPGSGKTKYVNQELGTLLTPGSGTLHIDADDIRARLPEYQGWNAMLTHDETKLIVDRLIDEIGVPCAADIIYDGTMNNPKRYLPIIDKLKSLGYVVVGYWIEVDPAVSRKRVVDRYAKSGRYVPSYVIDDFYRPEAKAGRTEVLRKLDAWRAVESPSWEMIAADNDNVLQAIKTVLTEGKLTHEYLDPDKEYQSDTPVEIRTARSRELNFIDSRTKSQPKPTAKPVKKNASTKAKPVAAPSLAPTPTVPPAPSSGPTDADLDRVEAMMAKLEQTLSSIAA